LGPSRRRGQRGRHPPGRGHDQRRGVDQRRRRHGLVRSGRQRRRGAGSRLLRRQRRL